MVKKKKSFESALKELEEIVEGMENNDLSIENSVKYYSKGMKLINFCQNILENAKLKISKLELTDGKYNETSIKKDFEKGMDK